MSYKKIIAANIAMIMIFSIVFIFPVTALNEDITPPVTICTLGGEMQG